MDLLNFADDNTIRPSENNIRAHLHCRAIKVDTEWFKINEIIVNLGIFQAITVDKNLEMKDYYPVIIKNETINYCNNVKLFVTVTNNAQSLDQHIPTPCKSH